jgi:hypothetical protein
MKSDNLTPKGSKIYRKQYIQGDTTPSGSHVHEKLFFINIKSLRD